MEIKKIEDKLKPYKIVLLVFLLVLVIVLFIVIRDIILKNKAAKEAAQAMNTGTLRYEDKYNYPDKQAFLQKVYYYADKLGVSPDNLMGVMYFESRLRPDITNGIGATGLIQFMPATAQSLGTTTADLAAMTGSEQMDYVYKYLNQYSYTNPIDLYLAIFFPAAIGKSDDWVIQAPGLSPSIIAKQNPIFNPNGNDYITVADVKNALNSYIS